jgi:hypothetical protein
MLSNQRHAQFTRRPAAAFVVLMGCLACAAAASAQTQMEGEAVAGVPFGVGRITVQTGGNFRINRVPRPGGGRIIDLTRRIIAPEAAGQVSSLESTEMMISEKSGRVFYPVFEKRERPVLKQFIQTPEARTVFFLFQGDAPLDLTFYAPGPASGPMNVGRDPAAHQRLLGQWWRNYSAAATDSETVRDYPPMVEEYLVDTLSRRLRLPLQKREQEDALQSQLSLLLQTENRRLETARSVLLGSEQREAASQALPEELPAPQAELLNPPPADTPIEPLAQRVPVECLYVRFGNFPNFLWLRHRMEDWGGELRDVVSERGLNFNLNERFQRQIGLRESVLAEVLGDRVIADVAIIGTDTFLTEGAALGMLFQAKNAAALNVDLTNQRLTAAREAKGSRQEKLTIAGKQVSFISTPDNSLRSFHAADGDFHLVTTSRTLVEWFLQTGAGQHPSLGSSDEFRFTRKNMPLSRGDTVFVYLSPQFFRNLLNPRYQIELERRQRSAVEMELYQIADLAARAEKKPAGSIDALVAADLLPAGFGSRPDGSQLVVADGTLSDSLRGARGSFVPVPDRTVDQVTAAEAAAYRRFADAYNNEWGAMDPVVAGIQHQALPEGKLERVTVDVQAAPLSRKHIELLNTWLGAPTDQRLAPVPGNVVSFEAVLRRHVLFRRRASPVRRPAQRRSHAGSRSAGEPDFADPDREARRPARVFGGLAESGFLAPHRRRIAPSKRPGGLLAISDRPVAETIRRFHTPLVPSRNPGSVVEPASFRESAQAGTNVAARRGPGPIHPGSHDQRFRLSAVAADHARQRPLHEHAARSTARTAG